jgi:hypothetical protein
MQTELTVVWIVGKVTDYPVWEFQGVFSTEQNAIQACGDNENFFVGSGVLDRALPTIESEWPDAYYPNRLLTGAA